jgi:glycosyltransferase involved in cell wall biosynthesis
MAEPKKLISIITPCYNEEANIQACVERVRQIFQEKLPQYEYEHIFCDNASSDRTVDILRSVCAVNRRVKVILNARNFGPFRSTFNALMSSSGDAVLVMLAADLQDPPELIPDFVERWEKGYEVVYGIRGQRQEGVVMASIRRFYYRCVSRWASIDIPRNVGEFQLIDKAVVNALRQVDDYYPYIRGLIANCGFRTTGIEYVWRRRERSISKNNIYGLIDQGMNGMISFANVPMRIMMFVGFFTAAVSLCYAVAQVVLYLAAPRPLAQPGIGTLIVGMFFFNGLLLFFLGLMGEYICAIHFQVRKRPMVIERERVNF